VARTKASALSVSVVGRSRPRRAYWRALIAECRRSGLSQAEFCRRRGILPGTFGFWKHTLAGEARGSNSVVVSAGATAPAFVPVRVVGRRQASDEGVAEAAPVASGAIEIVLVGHRRVRVRGQVDTQWLGQVLRTVEMLGC
jgi:hypothetical protein